MELSESVRFVALGLCVAVAIQGGSALAQAQGQDTAPDAPGAQAQVGQARAAANAALPPLPPVNPKNFTASTPTTETVNEFLKQSWGYDPNRVWQVQAIQKTPVQGLSKVFVVVEEKGAAQQQPSSLSFFTLPDGKHLIAEDVMPFGARPFDDYRKTLQREANGPARGATGKDLLLVEFADFQCPHCKEAQPTVERLLKDFPNARFVAENYPLPEIHSEALKSAEYAVCVAKLGGDGAYFKFADGVYGHQEGLTPQGSDAVLRDAVTAAGQDPAKVAACAAQPDTETAVQAQRQLGSDLGVNSTPTLFINGRGLPFGGIPYDNLKQIVEYQEKIDGVPGAGK